LMGSCLAPSQQQPQRKCSSSSTGSSSERPLYPGTWDAPAWTARACRAMRVRHLIALLAHRLLEMLQVYCLVMLLLLQAYLCWQLGMCRRSWPPYAQSARRVALW
jgi:hypothetical protein